MGGPVDVVDPCVAFTCDLFIVKLCAAAAAPLILNPDEASRDSTGLMTRELRGAEASLDALGTSDAVALWLSGVLPDAPDLLDVLTSSEDVAMVLSEGLSCCGSAWEGFCGPCASDGAPAVSAGGCPMAVFDAVLLPCTRNRGLFPWLDSLAALGLLVRAELRRDPNTGVCSGLLVNMSVANGLFSGSVLFVVPGLFFKVEVNRDPKIGVAIGMVGWAKVSDRCGDLGGEAVISASCQVCCGANCWRCEGFTVG